VGVKKNVGGMLAALAIRPVKKTRDVLFLKAVFLIAEP
jgi:hypothetical protein